MAETPLSILWLLDLQPRFGIRHGATLRWLHFSRELVERGHSVCLSVNEDEPGDLEASSALLEEYRLKGWLTSHATTRYRFPSATGRRAHLRVHPTLTNQALASFQDETATRVRSLIEASRVDVVIISQRKLLFLAPRLGDRVPVVVDWMDSLVLHESRLARSHFRHGAWRETTGACKRMAQAVLQERHYGRRSSANILVSPVDLGLFNRLTGRPDRGRLLLNGVDSRPRATPVPAYTQWLGSETTIGTRAPPDQRIERTPRRPFSGRARGARAKRVVWSAVPRSGSRRAASTL